MGSTDFYTTAKGKSAKEAFQRARDHAHWESGHGGYSGTIAEKGSFVMISVPAGKTPSEYAQELIDKDDPRISDKWGPAGCIALGDGKFLFFGWASC